MNTKTTPPNFSRVLFPLKGNEAKVEQAQKKYGIKIFFNTYILYEGSNIAGVKSFLTGGVCA